MNVGSTVVGAILGAVVCGAGGAAAQEYHVDREAARSVTFTSRAAIEEFQGRTERIDGYLIMDGDGVRVVREPGGTEFYLEVDLASLDTGIGLRDRHMREDYLETERWPYATFDGEVGDIRAEGEGFRATLHGTFAVHGVEAERTIQCDVDPDGSGWEVACGFPVRLPDHDIEIPKVMFLKLAEEVQVDLRFRLRLVEGGTP